MLPAAAVTGALRVKVYGAMHVFTLTKCIFSWAMGLETSAQLSG